MSSRRRRTWRTPSAPRSTMSPRNGSIFAPIAAWPPMAAEIAYAKLAALAAGAELARKAVQ
jgi:hypothetical protein